MPAGLRLGDKLRVLSEPTVGKSYVGAVLTVVDPVGRILPTALWCSVTYADGRSGGPFHGWVGYELELVERAPEPTVNGTDFVAGDRLRLLERGELEAPGQGFYYGGRKTGALATVISVEEFTKRHGDGPMPNVVPYIIDGEKDVSYCPAYNWELANAKTADETEFGKGVHVLCTSSGGDFANGRGVEEGVYYVVRSYTPNADERLSGLVTIRGVEGRYSTQRFRKATEEEVKGLVQRDDALGNAFLNIDFGQLEERIAAFLGRHGTCHAALINLDGGGFERRPFVIDEASFLRGPGWPWAYMTGPTRFGDLFGTVTGRMTHDRVGDISHTEVTLNADPAPEVTNGCNSAGDSLTSDRGARFNSGKRRMDLLPPDALAVIADVYTRGAEKYAERNWEKGMPWSEVIASMERHSLLLKAGEDYDQESRQLHSAHIAWNAMALLTYHLRGIGSDDRYVVSVPPVGGADLPAVVKTDEYQLYYTAAGMRYWLRGQVDSLDSATQDRGAGFIYTQAEVDQLKVKLRSLHLTAVPFGLSDDRYVIAWGNLFWAPGPDGKPTSYNHAVVDKAAAGVCTKAEAEKLAAAFNTPTVTQAIPTPA